MSEPQHQDDPTIADDDNLWRRVPIGSNHILFDENLGRYRPTSAAFDDSPDGSSMSILIEQIVLQSGRTAQSTMVGHDSYALASITARLARTQNQAIVRDPQPDEEAHGLVCGKKTKGVKSKLAKGAAWVIPPPDAHSLRS